MTKQEAIFEQSVHDAVIRAVTEISGDVKALLEDALSRESNDTARSMLRSMLDNVDIAKAADKGVVAIAVSQCLHGGVDMGIYAVGTKAQKAGIISGGNMTVEYASAVLADMLAHGRTEATI